MQHVDELTERQTIFELPVPPSYKDFFADSYGSASLFLFQLVSSFKKCPFGLETACFNSILRYGIRSAKISVLRHTGTSKSSEENINSIYC